MTQHGPLIFNPPPGGLSPQRGGRPHMAGNQILLGLPRHLVGSFGFQTAPQWEIVYSTAV